MMDSPIRSLVKAVSWRILGSLGTLLLALYFTKDIALAGLFTASEFVYKIILYWIHERLWERWRPEKKI
jgi:uncharacterized membrane protein